MMVVEAVLAGVRGLVLGATRNGGAWTGVDAVAYAGRTTTFVLTGVRE
jgi:hypothetical protein